MYAVLPLTDRCMLTVEFAVGIWGFHASEKLLIPVMKIAMSAKPPSYREVIELDRRIRSFKLPATPHTVDSPSTAASLMCFVRSHYLEVSKCFVSRTELLDLRSSIIIRSTPRTTPGVLRTGTGDEPAKPTGWPLRPLLPHSLPMRVESHRDDQLHLQTTSRHSLAHMDDLVLQLQLRREFAGHFCGRTTNGVQVVLGAVASRCKDLEIDPPPLAALHQACLLFEAGSKTNSRAAKALVSLRVFLSPLLRLILCPVARPAQPPRTRHPSARRDGERREPKLRGRARHPRRPPAAHRHVAPPATAAHQRLDGAAPEADRVHPRRTQRAARHPAYFHRGPLAPRVQGRAPHS